MFVLIGEYVMAVMKTEKVKKPLVVKEFTASEKNKIVEKLITARVGLLLRHPFLVILLRA